MQYDENAEKYGYEGEMTPLKCDELKAYKGDVYIPVYGSIADAEVYLKKDVDAAIAELKDVIHELQVDLEGAKATAYAESVDAYFAEQLAEKDKEIALLKERICNGDVSRLTWIDDCIAKDEEIAVLKDKCQMHDFFWEGCSFAKRGFKNTIAVSEAFDTLEAENESLLQQNRELCQAMQVMYSKEEYDKQKHKRCLDKAEMCKARYDAEDARVNGHGASWDYTSDEMKYWERWQKRWLELAEKFKDKEVTNAVDKSNA